MMRQRGFGAIAAIVILVILAALAAAIVSVGSTQQMTSAQDVLSARAWQAARAGNEWGLYQALKGTWKEGAASDPCPAGVTLGPGTAVSQTLNLTTEVPGFYVAVTGECWRYNEGETSTGIARVLLYRITAVACPAANCPPPGAAAAGPGYVERTRVVLATN